MSRIQLRNSAYEKIKHCRIQLRNSAYEKIKHCRIQPRKKTRGRCCGIPWGHDVQPTKFQDPQMQRDSAEWWTEHHSALLHLRCYSRWQESVFARSEATWQSAFQCISWRPDGQIPCTVPRGGFPKGTQAVAPWTSARSTRREASPLPTRPSALRHYFVHVRSEAIGGGGIKNPHMWAGRSKNPDVPPQTES